MTRGRHLPLALAALILAGCGGSGSSRDGPPAVTLNFLANPATVGTGTAATLSWTSSNATTCTASGGWSGPKQPEGSQSTGNLSATTTYTLTCDGDGDSAMQSLTVTVTSTPPAPTVTLTATPTTVSSGSSAVLNWTTGNATTCTASGGWNGPKGLSGSASTGTLTVTTTFRLDCTGPGGSGSSTRTVTVTNPPPVPTITLNANPATVASGESSMLTWTSSNATSCTASGGWSGPRSLSGNQSTGNLSATTVFTLECTGAGGQASVSRTVTVSTPPPAPTVTLTANPATVTSGQPATLNWSSSNATGCTASGGWTGPKPLSGNQSTGSLSVTTTYTLTCTGAGGPTSASRTVTVTSSSALFPLHTEPGKRYLIDAQGEPFFMNGDTPWDLIVGPTAAEVDTYLEDRHNRGVNTILVELIEHAFAGPATATGLTPFTGAPFATPREAYFDYAVEVVDKAAARGMLVIFTPAFMGVSGTGEGWISEMNSAGTTTLRNFGVYVGNKFAGRDNILWMHGGDRDGSAQDLSLAGAIAEGIVSTDPQGRWLHTFHGSRGTSGLQAAGNQPWLSVNNLYTSSGDIPENGFTAYAANTMPVFLSEARYEDNGGNGLFIRQQAYHAIFSGAMTGHLMGNDPLWYFGNNWQAYLDSGGARSLPYIRDLYLDLDWTRLIPDAGNSFLVSGISSNANRRVAALADDGSFGVLYTPDNVSPAMSVNLARLTGPRVHARWYDPTNGAYATVSGSPFTASGNRTFQPTGLNADGARDWVLVLESVP